MPKLQQIVSRLEVKAKNYETLGFELYEYCKSKSDDNVDYYEESFRDELDELDLNQLKQLKIIAMAAPYQDEQGEMINVRQEVARAIDKKHHDQEETSGKGILELQTTELEVEEVRQSKNQVTDELIVSVFNSLTLLTETYIKHLMSELRDRALEIFKNDSRPVAEKKKSADVFLKLIDAESVDANQYSGKTTVAPDEEKLQGEILTSAEKMQMWEFMKDKEYAILIGKLEVINKLQLELSLPSNEADPDDKLEAIRDYNKVLEEDGEKLKKYRSGDSFLAKAKFILYPVRALWNRVFHGTWELSEGAKVSVKAEAQIGKVLEEKDTPTPSQQRSKK